MYGFSWLLKNDYFLLTKFLVPLAFTEIAVDIGDQVSHDQTDELQSQR